MTELFEEIEVPPASYPPEPSGLGAVPEVQTGVPMPLSADVIWPRIEAWIDQRWTSRSVTWIVEGPGDFDPPLSPINSASTDLWNGSAWESVTLDASFMGGWSLPGDGPYRINADVGGGTVPEVVNQAYRRLHDYMACTPGRPTYTQHSTALDIISENWSKPEVMLARAMQNSGAGDLLRVYRRTK